MTAKTALMHMHRAVKKQDLTMTDRIGGVKKSGPDNDGPNDVTFGMENYNGLTTRR